MSCWGTCCWIQATWSLPGLTLGVMPGPPQRGCEELYHIAEPGYVEMAPNLRWRQQVGQKLVRSGGQCPGPQCVLCYLLLHDQAPHLTSFRLVAPDCPRALMGQERRALGEMQSSVTLPAHGVVSYVILAFPLHVVPHMDSIRFLMSAVEHPFRCLAANLYFLWWGIILNLFAYF